ncbi:FitA-like ribbon-helix-helix domain-containing protein [Acaryochloris marina NIES-2412]|uniref:FitA-like ribbon-helix-helix domain-containing protein n=1 Tax=Acaryochloris marina TaxID=155978 RepID=UPI00405832A6
MASITIRNLDEDIKIKLRVQAAQNNRSMEEEARIILRQALAEAEAEPNIADLALQLFGQDNGIELEAHPTVLPRELE